MAAEPVGIQARGKAGIFGGSINPLQVYLQHEATKQRMAQRLYDEERQQRDKMLDNFDKWSPDKVREPFYDEVNQFVQANVRDEFMKLRNAGVPVAQIQRQMQKVQGDANTLVHTINGKMDMYDEAMKTLNGNDMGKFYKPETKKRIRDIYFNGRQARLSGDIDTDLIQYELDNPANFNLHNIITEFVKDLPNRVHQDYREMADAYGQRFEREDVETKLPLLRDAQGNLIMDPFTNTYKVDSASPEVYRQAMKDPFIAKVVNAYAGDDIAKQKEVIVNLVEDYNPVSVRRSVQMGHKLPSKDVRYTAYGSGFSHPIADLEARDDRYEKIVKDRRQDLLSSLSDPNSDLKAFYGNVDGKGNVVAVKDPKQAKNIILAYVGQPEGDGIDLAEWNKMGTVDQALYQQAKGRLVKKDVFPIGTEEERRKTKIALSLRQDKLDPKRSIGEEFANFIEAKYQDSQKNKAKGKSIAEQMKDAARK